MAIPDLSIPLSDLLNSYGINSYEDLIKYITNIMNTNKNEYTISRLINVYTRLFYDELSKINNSLIKIFKIIFKKKFKDKVLDTFLIKWFTDNNNKMFKLNIYNDVKKFLNE